MKKYLIVSTLAIILFSQCEILGIDGLLSQDSSKEVPKTVKELIDQNRIFSLQSPKSIDLNTPDSTENLTDETPGVITDKEGQQYVTKWSVNRKHYSAISNPDKFVLYNANASVLWPGNLIQGKSMLSGTLDPIPVSSRKPITVYCTTISGATTTPVFQEVESPSGSNITNAMNKIVENFYGTSAQLSYTKEKIYNKKSMMFNLNAGYSNATYSIESDLGIDWTEEKQRVMIKLTQQYYSMAIDNPPGYSGIFGDDVDVSELSNYTSAENPMLYIDSVTYGRTFILVYESSDMSFDLASKLDLAFNSGITKGDLSVSSDYAEVVSNSQVKCFAMGGNAEDALGAAQTLEGLDKYLKDGASLSGSSIGVPISYTLRYLKDATLVKMNNTMEYYIDEKTPIDISALKSKVNFTLDKVTISGSDSGYDLTMKDIEVKVSFYDFVTNGYVIQYKSDLGDKTITSSGHTWTPGTGFELFIPKQTGSKIKIEISGREDDGNGDTYFESHSNGKNILEIVYNSAQNMWENGNSTNFSVTANDPDDSEHISAEVAYKLNITDYLP